jgi:hypothetical protein
VQPVRTDRTTDRPTDLPNNRPTNRPTDQRTDRPTERTTDRPIDQSTDRPTNGPTDQPTDQPNNRSINRTTDRPTDQPNNRSINQPTNRPTDAQTHNVHLLTVHCLLHVKCQFCIAQVTSSVPVVADPRGQTVRVGKALNVQPNVSLCTATFRLSRAGFFRKMSDTHRGI